MEDDLDAWELVWVVAHEQETIVNIKMLAQQFHDRINYHFNDVALFYQLSGLEETFVRTGMDNEIRTSDNCTSTFGIICIYIDSSSIIIR